MSAHNYIDVTGQTFGNWSVLKKVERKDTPKRTQFRTHFLCQCKCGKEKVVDSYYLRTGIVDNCGCLTSNKKKLAKQKAKGESGFNQLFLRYKIEATNKGLKWELESDLFKELTSSNCHYCSTPAKQEYFNNGAKNKEAKEHSKYLYNGIDRKNNIQGYTKSNVVPACGDCNLMKKTRSYEKFLEKISQIYKTVLEKK